MSDLRRDVVAGPAAGLQPAAAERRQGGLLLLPPQAAASVQLPRHPQLRRYGAILHSILSTFEIEVQTSMVVDGV